MRNTRSGFVAVGFAASVFAAAGCYGETDTSGPADGGATDANSAVDSGRSRDSSPAEDGAQEDGAQEDAGPFDDAQGRPEDAQIPDGGTADTDGEADAGADAGTGDDAEETDSGSDVGADAGAPATYVFTAGPEEAAGSTGGMSRPSLALDSALQPHIVADRDLPLVYIFHKIGGAWTEELFAQQTPETDAARIFLPHIEIDSSDRGWVSAWFGVKDGGTMAGQGVWLVENIASAPAKKWLGLANSGYKNGNLALDPFEPDRAVVMTREGTWQKFGPSGATGEKGKMNVGPSGEKIRFAVRPRPGQAGVWHAVMSGYGESPAMYRNSLFGAPVAWASQTVYPEMGGDMIHPGLGMDGADPAVGFMAIRYNAGLLFNVWDGGKMVFDPAALPAIDPAPSSDGNGTERFPPQWATAPGPGALVCWTGANKKVLMRHVLPTGVMGEPAEIASGSNCTIFFGADGHLHMAYVNGGMKYRKIAVEKQ
jgi:hypothetical protein